MDYSRGTLQYGVGEANYHTAQVDWEMIQRAIAGEKMTKAQLNDFRSLVDGGFQSGVCFALSNRWAADFLYFHRTLNGMARPPYGLVSDGALANAHRMQSEHMTRVRKRVAQDKFDLNITGIERKVMRKYTLLDQDEVFGNRALVAGMERHAAVDIIMAMQDSSPMRLGLTFHGSGHDLGLVCQGAYWYIFDPNVGLIRYAKLVDFARDLELLLMEPYSEGGAKPASFSLHRLRAKD
jgi:hypothetical protein